MPMPELTQLDKVVEEAYQAMMRIADHPRMSPLQKQILKEELFCILAPGFGNSEEREYCRKINTPGEEI